MAESQLVPVPRIIDPETECECECPVIIREEKAWAAGSYCCRCGLPPPAALWPRERDELEDRLRGLSTYAEFVAELSEPDEVWSGERLNNVRERLERFAKSKGPKVRTFPGPETVRHARWFVGEFLKVDLYETSTGDVMYTVGILQPVAEREQ